MTKGSLYYKKFVNDDNTFLIVNKSHTYRILGTKDSTWNRSRFVVFYDTSSDRRSISEVQFDFFKLGFERVE